MKIKKTKKNLKLIKIKEVFSRLNLKNKLKK